MAAPFKLDHKVTIEAPPTGRDSYNRPSGAWTPVAVRIWANVQQVLPSRSESTVPGVRVAVMPARLRIRKNAAISSKMRVTLHDFGDMVMEITAGPALLDDRMHVEYMLEGYSS